MRNRPKGFSRNHCSIATLSSCPYVLTQDTGNLNQCISYGHHWFDFAPNSPALRIITLYHTELSQTLRKVGTFLTYRLRFHSRVTFPNRPFQSRLRDAQNMSICRGSGRIFSKGKHTRDDYWTWRAANGEECTGRHSALTFAPTRNKITIPHCHPLFSYSPIHCRAASPPSRFALSRLG